jgi:hypothetical protein
MNVLEETKDEKKGKKKQGKGEKGEGKGKGIKAKAMNLVDGVVDGVLRVAKGREKKVKNRGTDKGEGEDVGVEEPQTFDRDHHEDENGRVVQQEGGKRKKKGLTFDEFVRNGGMNLEGIDPPGTLVEGTSHTSPHPDFYIAYPTG